MSDKKISELSAATSINQSDVSILVSGGVDYKFAFSTLLQFLSINLAVGANISFGVILPQNTLGKNGDVFINTTTGSFAQKISGTWNIVYTLPSVNSLTDGTVLYGLGVPGTSIGNNNDTYIDTGTGIFYKKAAGSWGQVFSMQTGPQGPQGTAGTNGTNGINGFTILNGGTDPSNLSTGVNGDFYINTSNYTFFGPKIAGAWPEGVSLVPPGVIAGGFAGHALTKASDNDYDTEWVNLNGLYIRLDGSYSSPSWINSLDWTKIASKPTTIAGYGITDFNTLGDARWLQLSGGTLTGDVQQPVSPVNANSLINKNYVDNLITGLTWKKEVKAGTISNITLSGIQTIDSIALVAGDRVLVKNQTTQSQNGIYVVASGSWIRTTDADTTGEIEGATVMVRLGTVNKDTQWTNTNSNEPVIGTDAITFGQIAGAGTYTNGTGISLTANVFGLDLSYTNSLYEVLTNKVTTLDNSTTHYPSTSAVTTALAAKVAGTSVNNYLTFWNGTNSITGYQTLQYDVVTGGLKFRESVSNEDMGIYLSGSHPNTTLNIGTGGVGSILLGATGKISALNTFWVSGSGSVSLRLAAQNQGNPLGMELTAQANIPGTFGINRLKFGQLYKADGSYSLIEGGDINNASAQIGDLYIKGGISGGTFTGGDIYLYAGYNSAATVKSGNTYLGYDKLNNVNGPVIIPALTASKVMFSGANKEMTSTGIGSSSQFIMGDGSLNSTAYSPVAGSASITTLGTIITGTWNGTAIADTYISSASNWNTAYTDRNKWDGGATGLVAATGRASLGLGSAALIADSTLAHLSGTETITGAKYFSSTLSALGSGISSPDGMGAINVTMPTDANSYAMFGMTRLGGTACAIGMSATNNFIIGTGTGRGNGSTIDTTLFSLNTATGDIISIGTIMGKTFRSDAYTVATLPAGGTGDIAYVTDASVTTRLSTVVGGGSTVIPVFFNGSNWICI